MKSRGFSGLAIAVGLTGCQWIANVEDIELTSYRDEVLRDKPLGYWRLGDASGSSEARDETGQRGGRYSSVALGQAGALAGDPDTAAHFDDIAYVNFGDYLDLLGSFSLEAWIKADSIDDNFRYIVTKAGDDAQGRQGYELYAISPSSVHFEIVRDNGYRVAYGAVLTGSWQHVVATFDGTQARVYVDAKLISEKKFTVSLLDQGFPLVIGDRTPNSHHSFLGTIDEVAIYGAALGQDRIEAHFAAAQP